jgi:hypothetical protein
MGQRNVIAADAIFREGKQGLALDPLHITAASP